MNATNVTHFGSELVAIATRVRHSLANTASHIVEIGGDLLEAKALAKRGEWGPFLESVGMHERTARDWMRLRRAYDARKFTIEDIRRHGLRGSLELLAAPREKTATVAVISDTNWKPRTFTDAQHIAAVRAMRDCLSAAEWAGMIEKRGWTRIVRSLREYGYPDPDVFMVFCWPVTDYERVSCYVYALRLLGVEIVEEPEAVVSRIEAVTDAMPAAVTDAKAVAEKLCLARAVFKDEGDIAATAEAMLTEAGVDIEP